MIPYFDASNLTIGGFRVHLFGVLIVIAVVVGHTTLVRRAQALKLGAPGDADAFAIVTVGAGMLAAWAEAAIRSALPAAAGAASAGIEGARAGVELSSVKGFAAAIVAGAVFLRARKLDARSFADAAAYAAPFAWIFARLGCAAAHDHLGRRSTSWLAVRFPAGSRLDMGLIELMFAPLLIALVVALARRGARRGALAGWLAVAYSVLRFVLDFFRADDLGPWSDPRYRGLTTAQWGAFLLFAVGAALIATSKAAPPLNNTHVV